LTGQHNLAVPIDFDVSTLTSQDQVKYELQSRAAILVHFTEGMIYLSAENEKAAEIAFREAVQIAEQYRDFEGQEVLYLFLSVSQQLQRDYSAAHRALDHAFQINRDYARAYVARGNLYYSKAVVSEFDVELFELALYEYQEAASSPDQPAGAYIPVKSDISIGNVYVVLAQLTNDLELFVRARDHYEQAMALCGEAEDEALLDLRTVAVCSIGVAYEIEGNVDRADQVYGECLASSSAEEMRTIVKRRLSYLEGTLLPTPSNEVVVTPIGMLPDYVEIPSPTASPYIPPTRPCTATPSITPTPSIIPTPPYVPPTAAAYPEDTPSPGPPESPELPDR
jgi:tetratricopeptide (TPR) repeat protein